MRLQDTKQFRKSYDRLPKHIQEKAKKAFSLFMAHPHHPFHPSLHIKRMKGTDRIWEGRIDYQYRFTFEFQTDNDETIVILRNIGSHDILLKE